MKFPLWILFCLFSLAIAGIARGDQPNILGYDEASSSTQRELEKELDATVDPKEMEEWLRILSDVPHHVGSPAGKQNAKFIADLMSSWGYDVDIEEYRILLPTPKARRVELVSPGSFVASLTEESLVEDPSTSRREDLLPPYNAFSIDGNVEGELVFVNCRSTKPEKDIRNCR